ncbi:gamma-mobile-trio recombinase GmtY [Pseudomonas sp. MBLB4136]|uniref:gamma-mobile-trio recombinase GmtY n=1 Tax=Pseudomonas sp. MBLB4136 TaxID=3451558 RepID=UPI003F74C8DE
MAYVLKVKARYRSDNTGKVLRLPALWTESGLLLSHLRYLAKAVNRGQSWRERSAFAIMLLIRYVNANDGLFDKTVELLENFNIALRAGTIDLTTLIDPSGLYWRPRSADDANNLLQLITHYTDWLAEQPEYATARANPFKRATSAEQRLNWCAYYHKNDNVFLNHLSNSEEAKSRSAFTRRVERQYQVPVVVEEVKKFPEEYIIKLLDEGFIRAGSESNPDPNMRADFKGRAITLLMHYGGVRKSEVFHLYLDDIGVDKKRLEAVVRIYHPSEGVSPDKRYKSRQDYLLQRFQRTPRTMYLKSERLHAGWKAPVLSSREKYFKVDFFPPDKATEFLYNFQNYLKYQRVDPIGEDHPYAFTNTLGQPETIKNFQRLHKAAVNRIGLAHEKYRGTTEHGHRHAFGYRLAEHGFTQVEIQKMMRHRSPTACLVYTQPTNEDLRETMERRMEK